MIMLKVFVIIGCFGSMSESQNGFRPNLPLGEYRVYYDKIYPCESTIKHIFKYNLYLSKKTELQGNLTFLVPLDDSFTLDVNFASWSLIGGWKPNAIVYIAKGACNNLKNVLGGIWFKVMKAFNIPTDDCPIPVGTYVTSGININELTEHYFPKVYFYGRYKVSFKIKNKKNEVVCCGGSELQLLRPLEEPV